MELDPSAITETALTGAAVWAAIRVHLWHIMRQITRHELRSDKIETRVNTLEVEHSQTRTDVNYLKTLIGAKHV